MKKSWLPILLIVVVAVIAYHNCLPNEMFWDDDDFILKNRFLRDWHYFPKFFSENMVAGSYLVSNYWRPMLLTVFSWAWHAWGTWAPGWHSLNILFHALDAVLVYFLFNRLFNNRTLSLVTALIFVAHPVHNENIVYANALGDPLAAFFLLSALILFVRFRQSGKLSLLSRNYWFALICYPLSIMSKEPGFVLCALLPVMDGLLLQKDNSFLVRARKVLAATWPFLVLAIVYVCLRATVLNFSNSFNFYNESNAFTTSVFLRLLTFFKAMAQYAGFLFFPHELRVERHLDIAHSIVEWDVLLGGAIVAAMLFCIFRLWRTRPLVSFGFAWFFICIAPASNVLVPINALIYEHFIYVPMIGVVLVLSDLAITWVNKQDLKKPAAFVLGAILIIFCAVNIHRNLDWRTAIGFYEQLVTYSPSYRVINNLGMEYADKGKNDKAETWYLKAIAMDPKNPVAYHNIGGTYRDTGRLKKAEASFKKAIELNPQFIFSYRSLADLYYRMGQLDEARKYLTILVNYDPTDQAALAALKELSPPAQ